MSVPSKVLSERAQRSLQFFSKNHCGQKHISSHSELREEATHAQEHKGHNEEWLLLRFFLRSFFLAVFHCNLVDFRQQLRRIQCGC